MIVITGAAGFIGSCVAAGLNKAGREDLLLVDDFSVASKERNHRDIKCLARVNREDFIRDTEHYAAGAVAVVHLGARTDTAEQDWNLFLKLNLDYTKAIWNFCTLNNLPLVYASSAATYGDGQLGFADDHALVPSLQPLNPYGRSKNEFDKWALEQSETPPFWAGLKFFNVYGPNEYHKGRMASVIFHAFSQISNTGKLKLFRSHNPDYPDGGQQRDFIYVLDIVRVIEFLLEKKPDSGIYNLGSGVARTFLDLGRSVFKAMEKDEKIEFIDTPEDIRDNYQYYTCADMQKLANAGYSQEFTVLEKGVDDYVKNYLAKNAGY